MPKLANRAAVCLLLCLLIGCQPQAENASEYPSRQVSIICPWSAGGGTDRVARYWEKALREEFDEPFVVVNKTGGGGVVGHQAGASARPDGYTMTIITFELCTMHRFKMTDLTYQDFDCLLQMNADPAAIIVKKDAPWQTLDAFLDAAKSGREGKLKMSGTAPRGAWDLARAGLMRAAGVPLDAITWVPKEGSAPSLVELLGGHLDAVCCSVPEAATQLESGDVRVLAVMAEDRLPGFPDIPTTKELGYDWVAVGWRGLALPKGTPPEIVSKLEEKCLKIAASDDYQAFMDKNRFGVKIRPADEFEEFLRQQDEQWGEVIEAVGYSKS